eukprot:jgi/Mesvir1/20459/Mv12352-RA.1
MARRQPRFLDDPNIGSGHSLRSEKSSPAGLGYGFGDSDTIQQLLRQRSPTRTKPKLSQHFRERPPGPQAGYGITKAFDYSYRDELKRDAANQSKSQASDEFNLFDDSEEEDENGSPLPQIRRSHVPRAHTPIYADTGTVPRMVFTTLPSRQGTGRVSPTRKPSASSSVGSHTSAGSHTTGSYAGSNPPTLRPSRSEQGPRVGCPSPDPGGDGSPYDGVGGSRRSTANSDIYFRPSVSAESMRRRPDGAINSGVLDAGSGGVRDMFGGSVRDGLSGGVRDAIDAMDSGRSPSPKKRRDKVRGFKARPFPKSFHLAYDPDGHMRSVAARLKSLPAVICEGANRDVLLVPAGDSWAAAHSPRADSRSPSEASSGHGNVLGGGGRVGSPMLNGRTSQLSDTLDSMEVDSGHTVGGSSNYNSPNGTTPGRPILDRQLTRRSSTSSRHSRRGPNEPATIESSLSEVGLGMGVGTGSIDHTTGEWPKGFLGLGPNGPVFEDDWDDDGQGGEGPWRQGPAPLFEPGSSSCSDDDYPCGANDSKTVDDNSYKKGGILPGQGPGQGTGSPAGLGDGDGGSLRSPTSPDGGGNYAAGLKDTLESSIESRGILTRSSTTRERPRDGTPQEGQGNSGGVGGASLPPAKPRCRRVSLHLNQHQLSRMDGMGSRTGGESGSPMLSRQSSSRREFSRSPSRTDRSGGRGESARSPNGRDEGPRSPGSTSGDSRRGIFARSGSIKSPKGGLRKARRPAPTREAGSSNPATDVTCDDQSQAAERAAAEVTSDGGTDAGLSDLEGASPGRRNSLLNLPLDGNPFGSPPGDPLLHTSRSMHAHVPRGSLLPFTTAAGGALALEPPEDTLLRHLETRRPSVIPSGLPAGAQVAGTGATAGASVHVGTGVGHPQGLGVGVVGGGVLASLAAAFRPASGHPLAGASLTGSLGPLGPLGPLGAPDGSYLPGSRPMSSAEGSRLSGSSLGFMNSGSLKHMAGRGQGGVVGEEVAREPPRTQRQLEEDLAQEAESEAAQGRSSLADLLSYLSAHERQFALVSSEEESEGEEQRVKELPPDSIQARWQRAKHRLSPRSRTLVQLHLAAVTNIRRYVDSWCLRMQSLAKRPPEFGIGRELFAAMPAPLRGDPKHVEAGLGNGLTFGPDDWAGGIATPALVVSEQSLLPPLAGTEASLSSTGGLLLGGRGSVTVGMAATTGSITAGGRPSLGVVAHGAATGATTLTAAAAKPAATAAAAAMAAGGGAKATRPGTARPGTAKGLRPGTASKRGSGAGSLGSLAGGIPHLGSTAEAAADARARHLARLRRSSVPDPRARERLFDRDEQSMCAVRALSNTIFGVDQIRRRLRGGIYSVHNAATASSPRGTEASSATMADKELDAVTDSSGGGGDSKGGAAGQGSQRGEAGQEGEGENGVARSQERFLEHGSGSVGREGEVVGGASLLGGANHGTDREGSDGEGERHHSLFGPPDMVPWSSAEWQEKNRGKVWHGKEGQEGSRGRKDSNVNNAGGGGNGFDDWQHESEVSLGLSHSNLSWVDLHSLWEVLRGVSNGGAEDLPGVARLALAGNLFDDAAFTLLAALVTGSCPGLRELDVSANAELTWECSTVLSELVEPRDGHVPLPHLTRLNCSDLALGNKGAFVLAEALLANDSIMMLQMDRCCVSEAGAPAIGWLLTQNRRLRSLSFAWNQIGEKGGASVMAGLKANTTLSHIDLSWNGIGNSGAGLMGSILAESKTLEVVALCGNGIGPAGAVALAEGLTANTGSLRVLLLHSNPLGAEGVSQILHAVHSKPNLQRIGLQETRLSDPSLTVADHSQTHKRKKKSSGKSSTKVGATSPPTRPKPSGNAPRKSRLGPGDGESDPEGTSPTRGGSARQSLINRPPSGTKPPASGVPNAPPPVDPAVAAPAPSPSLRRVPERALPSKQYKLDLSDERQRGLAVELVGAWHAMGPECWARAQLGADELVLTDAHNWPEKMPRRGTLQLDFVWMDRPPLRARPIADSDLSCALQEMRDDTARTVWVQQLINVLAAKSYFSCDQVATMLTTLGNYERAEAAIALFPCVVDLARLPKLLMKLLSQKELDDVYTGVGVYDKYTPGNLTGFYSLDMNRQRDRYVMLLLLLDSQREGLYKTNAMLANFRNLLIDGIPPRRKSPLTHPPTRNRRPSPTRRAIARTARKTIG